MYGASTTYLRHSTKRENGEILRVMNLSPLQLTGAEMERQVSSSPRLRVDADNADRDVMRAHFPAR